jgi:hypothetical protein
MQNLALAKLYYPALYAVPNQYCLPLRRENHFCAGVAIYFMQVHAALRMKKHSIYYPLCSHRKGSPHCSFWTRSSVQVFISWSDLIWSHQVSSDLITSHPTHQIQRNSLYDLRARQLISSSSLPCLLFQDPMALTSTSVRQENFAPPFWPQILTKTGPPMLALCWTLYSVAGLLVAARVYTALVVTRKFGLGDIFMLCSIVSVSRSGWIKHN